PVGAKSQTLFETAARLGCKRCVGVLPDVTGDIQEHFAGVIQGCTGIENAIAEGIFVGQCQARSNFGRTNQAISRGVKDRRQEAATSKADTVQRVRWERYSYRRLSRGIRVILVFGLRNPA